MSTENSKISIRNISKRLGAAQIHRDRLQSKIEYLNVKIKEKNNAFAKAEVASLNFAIMLIDREIKMLSMILQRAEDKLRGMM